MQRLSSVVAFTLRAVELMHCSHVQTSQMKHGLSVVADLTKGDAEMQARGAGYHRRLWRPRHHCQQASCIALPLLGRTCQAGH